jgi:Kef-type K+ transport system membrane component KefB
VTVFKELLTKDLEYLTIFSLVLILPKVLMRFKIPSGITALLIGIVLTILDPDLKLDPLFRFLSQIGITSLFLFAGLEVDLDELKQDRVYLGKYLSKFLIVLLLIAAGLVYFLELNFQNSLILSLGIFTPSAGFILTSLHSYDIDNDQEYWVKSKAISKEVLSIVLLFVALQGNNLKGLAVSAAFFIGLFFILPFIFRFFFKFISPFAPHSEIPFLVALSLISGVISKELGAYYLVGAFVVGIIGSRFKNQIFKEGEETLLRSLSGFFSVFLPFYFFYAGLKLSIYQFNLKSLFIGGIIFLLFIPIRMFLISYSLKNILKSVRIDNYKISLSLMPTLVFGLVIAGILLERGVVDSSIIYGLIFYTFIASITPAIIFFPLTFLKINLLRPFDL